MKVSRLLATLNGDWSIPLLTHHCVNCNECPGGIEDTKKNVFAALLACNVLAGTSGKMPSTKDWGSVSHHCSQQSLGILCHKVLPRVLENAFGRWDDALPDDRDCDVPDGQDPEEFRKYLRKKAWRSKLVMSSPAKQLAWCLQSWALEPMDHLLQRLQWIDERGHSLLDCVSTQRSPILECEKDLLEMLIVPCETGPMAVLHHRFTRYGDADLAEFVLKGIRGERQMGTEEVGTERWNVH